MNILITGGAGFIGTNLISYINKFYKSKVKIFVIDNESVGKKKDIKSKINKFYKLDISSENTYKKIKHKIDTVIHLAAQTEVVTSTKNPSSIINDNILGTFYLFEFCRKNNIKKIIVASTGGAIIGNYSKTIFENTPAKPISPYGLSKLFSENLAFTYNNTYGMLITCLRFANVYGPGCQRKNSVISKFLLNIKNKKPLVIYGDGRQKRDFIYVNDICEAIIKSINSTKIGTFQLASGKTTSILKLVKIIKNLLKHNNPNIKIQFSKQREGEVFETKISNKKALNDLKFNAKTKIEDGILKTLRWIENL